MIHELQLSRPCVITQRTTRSGINGDGEVEAYFSHPHVMEPGVESTRLLEKARVERDWSPSWDSRGRDIMIPLPREVQGSQVSIRIDCYVPAPSLYFWICMELEKSFLEIRAIHAANAVTYPIHNGRVWRENRRPARRIGASVELAGGGSRDPPPLASSLADDICPLIW